MCVSYKAGASCFRGRRAFSSAGCGPAKLSWVFKSLLAEATCVCQRIGLVGLQEPIVLEILDLWLILYEYIPSSPSAWFFFMCFRAVSYGYHSRVSLLLESWGHEALDFGALDRLVYFCCPFKTL